jgi:vitamin B12 transporter
MVCSGWPSLLKKQPLGVTNTRLGRLWAKFRQPGYRPTKRLICCVFRSMRPIRPHAVGDDGDGYFVDCFTMNSCTLPARLAALPLALACAFAASPLLAQTQLKETVVTASRLEQRLQDSLSSVTLINREDIDRAQAVDLPMLLRQAAGVEITQLGGVGTQSSAFIRGAESRHTLVLIDGIAVNNLNFSTTPIEHLPLSNIDRIEVVRGNVSSLYGSSALGGVIQIFTREAGDQPYGNVTVQAGPRSSSVVQAGAGIRVGNGTRLAFTAENLDDGGINAINQSRRPGTNPDLDGYRRQAWSVGVTQDIGNGKVGFSTRRSSGASQYDSEFGPATQKDESKFDLQSSALTAQFKPRANLNLNAALTTQSDSLIADVTAFPFRVKSLGDGGSLGLDWQFANGQTLAAGYETVNQKIESDTAYTQSSRQQNSTRLGYLGQFESHQLQLNVRQDSYSDFGNAATWLAAYAWSFADGWRVGMQGSTGFNAPTFNDLYNPFGGNARLRPESVDSSEASLQYAKNGQEMRLVLFTNQYRDLIANDAFFSRVNVDKARNDGAEISYRGQFGSTRVQGGFTAQNPVDSTTNLRLLRRAQTVASLSVFHDVGAWSFGGNLRYSGERPDLFAGVRRSLPGYSLLDLNCSYKISSTVKLLARIDNVFDEKYEPAWGYNSPGAAAFVGITASLGN